MAGAPSAAGRIAGLGNSRLEVRKAEVWVTSGRPRRPLQPKQIPPTRPTAPGAPPKKP